MIPKAAKTETAETTETETFSELLGDFLKKGQVIIKMCIELLSRVEHSRNQRFFSALINKLKIINVYLGMCIRTAKFYPSDMLKPVRIASAIKLLEYLQKKKNGKPIPLIETTIEVLQGIECANEESYIQMRDLEVGVRK